MLRTVAAMAGVAAAGLALVWGPAPSRVMELAPGVTEITVPIELGSGGELRGHGSTLRAAASFRGRALVICRGQRIRVSGFALDGNRAALEVRTGLPPYDRSFARFTPHNGILVENSERVVIADVTLREVAGFAVLVNRSRQVRVEHVIVEDSGSRNPAGRNNSTGGILFEEGTSGFLAAHCTLRRIRGNGIWTHSLYTSPRNREGDIADNHFEDVGRDAIQVGHAVAIRVERNTGARIGFPVEDVDMEGRAIPVAVDTAGNVEESVYANNRFEDINGKCFDLDGFHDGEITGNTCSNRQPPEAYQFGNFGIVMNNSNPDMQSRNIRITENEITGMKFGGIFVIGTGHTIERNRLLDLNTAHCNEEAARFGCYYGAGEPDMLRSGIYLGLRAERPARAEGNSITGNVITGFKMDERCVGVAPGIAKDANRIAGNECRGVR